MTHLSDEQLEDVLTGAIDAPAHLAGCADCRDRLAQQRQMRAAVQSAFAGVRAPAALAQRVQAALDRPRAKVIRLRWIVPLAAAAAMILAAGLAVHLFQSQPVRAGLIDIHERNLAAGHGFYTEADPAKLAAYMKGQLGFEPGVPTLGEGMALRGCCVAHFRNRPVGSYVVDTPRGAVSVIVVTDTPELIGIERTVQRDDQTFGVGSFARCNMATLRLNDYTYCAVGEVSIDDLVDLLGRLTH